MYCIAFNGPPRSGKDTACFAIADRFDGGVTPAVVRSLSMPMRKVAFAMIDRPYSYREYEEVKDRHHDVFNGETMRRFMIRYSEEFAKMTYGQTVWAKSLLSGLGTSIHLPGVCLIPDIGFQMETNHLVEAFGPERFLLVRLLRRDTTFVGDSRNYVHAPHAIELFHGENQTDVLVEQVLAQAETMGWDI